MAFIFLSLVSAIGSKEAAIYPVLLSLDLSLIRDYFINHNDYFRLPDTLLRIIVFALSIICLIMVNKFSLNNDIRLSRKFHSFIKLLLLIFFSTFLTTDNIYNIAALFLLLLSIYYFIYHRSIPLSILESSLIFVISLFFFYPLLTSLIFDTPIKELDNYSRFFILIPIFYMFREIKLPLKEILLILNISSILVGLFALYTYFILGEIRVRGFTSSATIFGNISLIYAMISFVSISYFRDNRKYQILCLSGLSLVLFAWILTGTRGSLIAIFFILLFSLFKENRILLISFSYKKLLGFLLLSGLIFFNSNTYNRFINSYNSMYNYMFDGGEHHWTHNDSFVPRFLIWNGAFNIISENLVHGVGLSNFNNALLIQISSQKINPVKPRYKDHSAGINHAHNQYLDIFAKTGILGFIILISLLSLFYYYFKKYKESENFDLSYSAIIGCLLIIMFSSNMLFHAILSHQQSTLFMVVILFIFAGMTANNSFMEDRR